MPPPYRRGNWFHSRSSSSEGERDAIVTLVKRSKTPQYSGLRWSGDKTLPLNVQFANEIGVNAATMQTKIRAFIRFGFIREGNSCPLEWTTLAGIWRRLIEEGDIGLQAKANSIEQLILAISLVLYSFDSEEYQINPIDNYQPLFELLGNVDANGYISQHDLESLIGPKGSRYNLNYWVIDFTRGNILREITGGFELTDSFPALLDAVRTISLPTTLPDNDWQDIHGDVLDERNPYRDAIVNEIERILEGFFDIESGLSDTQRNAVNELVSSTDITELEEIDSGDYRIEDTYSKVKRRRKQSAWSKKVRLLYNYTCCVPECDVNTPDYTDAAHIKKYSLPETGAGHRANPRNGLCFCKLCHNLFDNGYFTLTETLRIEISPSIRELESERLKNVIINSDGQPIDPLPTIYLPNPEFIRYHRRYKFLR